VKGSVFKTLKYLGFLPKDVPTGVSRLGYYTRAGVEKTMGKVEKIMGIDQEHFETSK
jgi:hydrogenase small subunit